MNQKSSREISFFFWLILWLVHEKASILIKKENKENHETVVENYSKSFISQINKSFQKMKKKKRNIFDDFQTLCSYINVVHVAESLLSNLHEFWFYF